MKATSVLPFLLLVASVAPASAAEEPAEPPHFVSGAQFVRSCSKDASTQGRALCKGYAEGIADYLNVTLPGNGIKKCIPANAASNEIIDLIVRYINAVPGRADQSAAGSAVLAILDKWRCGWPRSQKRGAK